MRSESLIRSVFVGISATCVLPCVSLAQGNGSVAGSTADMLRLLSVARPREIIRLRPGVYSQAIISGFRGSATLTSLDPSRPAIFTNLTIRNSSGLTLSHLDLDNTTNPVEPYGAKGTIAFKVLSSQNITLSHLDVHGSPYGTLETDQSGVFVRDSQHVTVEDSDFHNLNNGLQHGGDDWLTVKRNHFHHLRDDGLRGGGSSNVLVEGNHCDSNHPDGAADKDHPDCIQFWTTNTKQPAHDITIVGNTYERGDGTPTQGVWMRDEVGTLPFQHVTVSGNVIKGAMYNGISVFGATDVKFIGNTVCQYRDQPSWLVVRVIDGVEVTGNSTSRLSYVKSTRIKDSGNRHIDDCKPTPSGL